VHVEKQPPVAGDDVGLAKTNRNILILLVLVNAGSQGLQGLLAPLTNELQAHLSVSLSTIATIQTCFLIAFALATPLWAFAAGRFSRRNCLIFVSALWGTCCGLVTLTDNPVLFGAGFALAAIGNAAILPLTFSMAMDIVPADKRGTTFGWLATGQVVSMGMAFLAGGILGAEFGWQLPFWIFAGSALIAVGLLTTILPRDAVIESSEGDNLSLLGFESDDSEHNLEIRFRDLLNVFKHPVNLWLISAAVLTSVADGALTFWFIAMLRTDHAMTAVAATWLTIGLFVAQIPGGVMCGHAADVMERKCRRGRIWLLFWLTIAAAPCYFAAFHIPWSGLSIESIGCLSFMALAALGSFITAAFPPLLFSAANDINAREHRSLMFALVSISRIAGRAIGIQAVSLVAVFVHANALGMGMAYTALVFIPSALCLLPVILKSATQSLATASSVSQATPLRKSA
jgi:predicted MFS family arabinose efflux permease